tara:strand:- start:8767 stop:9126 length:360 start_codon:yes stop_codon:yes gene_type:complete
MSGIFGIGVDVVYEKEIQKWFSWNDERLKKTLSPREFKEMKLSKWTVAQFAARIAAKEAFYKASNISFKANEVGVFNDEKGKPNFEFSENIKSKLANKKTHLSLSHSSGCSIAFVVVEG